MLVGFILGLPVGAAVCILILFAGEIGRGLEDEDEVQ